MNMIPYDDEFILKGLRGASKSRNNGFSFLEKILLPVIKLGMIICSLAIFILCRIPLVSSLLESFVRTYSRGAVGFFLRGAYYNNKLKTMGKNVLIDMGAYINEPGAVEIQDNVHIDTYVTIRGASKERPVRIGRYVHITQGCILDGGAIEIGDYAGVAARCCIYSVSNYYRNPNGRNEELLSMSAMAPEEKQYIKKDVVTIEDYGFLGMGCIVLPGVRIGHGSVIGAGSVVTNSIPSLTIAVGAPAKILKKR